MTWWATIEFESLIESRLPYCLRDDVKKAFINSVVGIVEDIYKDTLYKMQHTCQVIYLEKVLNEYFQVENYSAQDHENTKVIYIDDAPVTPTKYIYLKEEIPPQNYLYLGTQFLTGDIDHFDFIIYIPSDFEFVEAKVRAEVDYYKLAGKKYTIELF